MARTIEPQHVRCVHCQAEVVLERVSSPTPDAPDMMRAGPLAWIGMIEAEPDATATELEATVIAACSEACVQAFLAPFPEPS